jgi:integral membrane sensor domain MASE1
VVIDSPPGHRASRFLLAALLVGAFLGAIVGLLLAGVDTWFIDNAQIYITEVRASWTS